MKLPLFLAATAVLSSAACQHLTTHVPGVLDMRSDGAIAPVDTAAKGGADRTGFDGIMYGDGVVGSTEVAVTDRKYWACSLFPVLNDSATEEISLAVGPAGALRNVRIGEQYTVTDVVIGFCGSFIPVVGIILPPHDFHFSGTRIKPFPEGMPAPTDGLPPLTPDAPPAPAAAPAPAAGGY